MDIMVALKWDKFFKMDSPSVYSIRVSYEYRAAWKKAEDFYSTLYMLAMAGF